VVKVQCGDREDHIVKTVKMLLDIAGYTYEEQGDSLLVEKGGYKALVTPGMWFVFLVAVDILSSCEGMADSIPVPRDEELSFMSHVMEVKKLIDKWVME
jgi:hypothetical protein